MGFKDFCCNLCAWFSVIGSATFAILAVMLTRHNDAVIEHKFNLALTDTEGITAAHGQMVVMSIVMVVAAALCFLSSFMYAKAEFNEEMRERKL